MDDNQLYDEPDNTHLTTKQHLSYYIVLIILLCASVTISFYYSLKLKNTKEDLLNIQGESAQFKTEKQALLDKLEDVRSELNTCRSAANVIKEVKCKNIDGVDGYFYIKYFSKGNYLTNNIIITPDMKIIDRVSNYLVSPDKSMLFIRRYSVDTFETPSAPGSNALTMIDINNNKIVDLFSEIYFPTYEDPFSWSPDNKGIVFTAGKSTVPDILGDVQLYAVVYCTTKCKVLARDAGPEGIGGNPAYFKDNKIVYTDIEGNETTLPMSILEE